MRLLRSFFGLFDPPDISINQKHRHLGDYLSAEASEDKIIAAEKYLGIWSPDRDARRRARAEKKTIGQSG